MDGNKTIKVTHKQLKDAQEELVAVERIELQVKDFLNIEDGKQTIPKDILDYYARERVIARLEHLVDLESVDGTVFIEEDTEDEIFSRMKQEPISVNDAYQVKEWDKNFRGDTKNTMTLGEYNRYYKIRVIYEKEHSGVMDYKAVANDYGEIILEENYLANINKIILVNKLTGNMVYEFYVNGKPESEYKRHRFREWDSHSLHPFISYVLNKELIKITGE